MGVVYCVLYVQHNTRRSSLFLTLPRTTMGTHSKPHALLLARPGMGHVIPVLELAHRLSSSLHFRVTVFLGPFGRAMSSAESHTARAAMARGSFDVRELPPVDVTSLVEPDAAAVTKLTVTMREMRPAVLATALGMRPKPTVLIVDLFGTEVLSIAEEIGVAAKYVFVASHALFLALKVYLPVLDKLVEGEYTEQKEPMKIPGCRPVRPDELIDPMLDRSNRQYQECVRVSLEIPTSDGVFIFIWGELQGETLAALDGNGELGRIMRVPVYPIGSIIRPNDPTERPIGSVFEWLDQQPGRSVVYVCLGSGGTLSFQQTTEMAWGLEHSGQRFLWVLRRPTVRTGDVASVLPEGFMDRVGRTRCGSHKQRSVGGFLSHCGWNSTLESLRNGVPMVTWPLYAEQRMNAVVLTEEIGVGVRPRRFPTAEGVIGREEIAELVRRVMVDGGMRDKAREIKLSSERAWSDGGSSRLALFQWAKRFS
ncbi:PREDICTED: UDP-glycosyltransferase 72D1 [Tarenaya hassleriana]|uniref:UDP-glycosyltransferase 72D1 n=1 Tax=Tarenaya hassleriana TaxID=28532 RepID=UPI0008FD3CA8|nr:PREDICTED: UDP-glycosyltransferase 72D1 [Tarenaya hassleriana]